MKSVCRKSCTNALTSRLVLTEPRARQQRTNDTGKENQKTVETTQNLINPISLKGFLSSFFAIWSLVFIKESLLHLSIRKLLPASMGVSWCCHRLQGVPLFPLFSNFLHFPITGMGRVSVRSPEPMDGKNWQLWSYWWLVVKKHHTVKTWQTQEPSANATEGQQKRSFLVTPRCHKQW